MSSKHRNVFSLLILVAALSVGACDSSSCEQSPTAPSGGPIPPVVRPPEISVPADQILHEGDSVTVTTWADPGTGSIAIAFVLLRDDNAAMNVVCGPQQGVGTRTATIVFGGAKYLWAKEHILNGVMLEAHFEDRNQAFRDHGCYFLDPDQNALTVHFERATKRTDIPLNWRVE